MSRTTTIRYENLFELIDRLNYCKSLKELTPVLQRDLKHILGAATWRLIVRHEEDVAIYTAHGQSIQLVESRFQDLSDFETKLLTRKCFPKISSESLPQRLHEEWAPWPSPQLQGVPKHADENACMYAVSNFSPGRKGDACIVVLHEGNSAHPTVTKTATQTVCSLASGLQRLLIQTQLEQARDRAVAALEAKSSFIANMSHELRTPMNGILGLGELLAETELSPEQKQYIDTVNRSGRSLLALINDVLDFSKIQGNHLILESIPFNMQELISDAVECILIKAEEKALSLYVDIDPKLPEVFLGDPVRLRQVLLNLLGNAIKFTLNGHVKIRILHYGNAEKYRVGDSFPFTIQVSDTGIGIEKESQQNLFRPFTQADSTTTRKFGGTGLGLAISKSIVELMDGEITLDSELHSGTSFGVCLSLVLGEEERKPLVPPEHTAYVVSDDERHRYILQRELRHMGILVKDDSCFQRSLNPVGSNVSDIDLLFVDYDLTNSGKSPNDADGVHGRTARYIVDQIRQHSLCNSKVVVLCRWNEQCEANRRFKGIATTLLKPCRMSVVHEIVLKHCVPSEKIDPVSQQQVHRCELQDSDAQRFLLHILVAEDNKVNQLVIEKVLSSVGCKITTVDNGLKAYELVLANEVNLDLIFMDCQMPVLDGYEATRKIREIVGGSSNIPIIALTASVSREVKDKCFESGMDDFVAKPFRKARIVEILRAFSAQSVIKAVG